MSATIGLPDRIEGGTFEFTFMATQFGGEEPFAFDIRFTWDVGAATPHGCMTSRATRASPQGRRRRYGEGVVAEPDQLLLAMTSVDLETEGWARVPGGAPTVGADATSEEILATRCAGSRWPGRSRPSSGRITRRGDEPDVSNWRTRDQDRGRLNTDRNCKRTGSVREPVTPCSRSTRSASIRRRCWRSPRSNHLTAAWSA